MSIHRNSEISSLELSWDNLKVIDNKILEQEFLFMNSCRKKKFSSMIQYSAFQTSLA